MSYSSDPLTAWGIPDGARFDVHHVVAAALERAAASRLLLQRWEVELHGTSNAAILPRSYHQRKGLHRSASLDWVNTRLLAADGAAQAIQSRGSGSRDENSVRARRIFVKMLQKLGDHLVEASGDAVAIALQVVLRQSDCEPHG